jgi:alkylation response protein AidB-like acyl-CoA dehydrogenase
LWLKAAEYGLLGIAAPERYGGLGCDVIFASILCIAQRRDRRAKGGEMQFGRQTWRESVAFGAPQ